MEILYALCPTMSTPTANLFNLFYPQVIHSKSRRFYHTSVAGSRTFYNFFNLFLQPKSSQSNRKTRIDWGLTGGYMGDPHAAAPAVQCRNDAKECKSDAAQCSFETIVYNKVIYSLSHICAGVKRNLRKICVFWRKLRRSRQVSRPAPRNSVPHFYK